MFVSKNTTLQDFEYTQNGEPFEISKDIALDRDYLDFLCSKFPKSTITILSGYDILYSSTKTLYNEEETKILADNANYVFEKYGRTLTFDENYSIKDAIVASRKINHVVNEINFARVNGEPLSPFEKFTLAYQFVTDRIYKEVEDGEDNSKSRRLISVLNSDKIVCVGFANLLATVLNRLDIPCTTQCIVSYDENTKAYGNHATCLVRLTDPKYNINGIYFSDPTGDHATTNTNGYGNNSFTSALVKYDTIKKFFTKNIMLDAAVVKEGTQTIREAADNALDVAPILANLFPEKTDGKPQNVIIRENINNQLKQLNIDEIMEDLISSISQEQVEMMSAETASRILNSSRIMYDYSNGQLDSFFNTVSQSLLNMGYSNKEIITLYDIYYSPENVNTLVINYFKKIHGYTEPYNNRQQSEIELARKKLTAMVSQFKDRLSLNMIKNKKHLDDCYSEILEYFSSFAVGKTFNSNDPLDDKFAGPVKYLISKGIPLAEIKLELKSMLSSVDYTSSYLEFNESLLDYLDTNEQELYSGYFLPYVQIYNEPYKADFSKLTKEARFVVNEDYERAYTNYFLSQGIKKEDAEKYAKRCLINTSTFSPDQMS